MNTRQALLLFLLTVLTLVAAACKRAPDDAKLNGVSAACDETGCLLDFRMNIDDLKGRPVLEDHLTLEGFTFEGTSLVEQDTQIGLDISSITPEDLEVKTDDGGPFQFAVLLDQSCSMSWVRCRKGGGHRLRLTRLAS
jgi:hypothetical protein